MSTMSSSARRINKEVNDLAQNNSSGMEAWVNHHSDITHLTGRFKGPPQTPYADGVFMIDIQLPDNYPFAPPKMRFITKIWHPNISSQTGAICLDTLSAKWTPVLTIQTALLSLQSLLAVPEPNDPQDAEVAKMMLSDPEAYQRKAREWAIRYANAPHTSFSSPTPAAPTTTTTLSLEERRRLEKQQQLQGYDEGIVDRFMDMGFSVSDVVSALRDAKVQPGEKRISDDVTQRVAEKLLGV